jgi:hypothetical protein
MPKWSKRPGTAVILTVKGARVVDHATAEKQRRVQDTEIARIESARTTREERIKRLRTRQRSDRKLICLAEIADLWARPPGDDLPNKNRRAAAVATLARALIEGEFTVNGRVQVWHVEPEPLMEQIDDQGRLATRHVQHRLNPDQIDWLRENRGDVKALSVLLDHCWARRSVLNRCFERTGHPWPPHFDPETKQSPAPAAGMATLANAASEPARHPRRGTSGYDAADRRVFSEIGSLISTGKARSPYGAALLLADDLAGAGTAETKAKRVSSRYRKMVRETPKSTVNNGKDTERRP